MVRYEPYRPMNLQEVEAELALRIADEEMIAVELKAAHKLIGNLYLGKREFEAYELGYVFNKRYWGKGYAREGCEALIEGVFASGVHRIYAECDPDNGNSRRLLERLGFAREAHFKQNVYFWKDDDGNSIRKDTYVYGLLHPLAT